MNSCGGSESYRVGRLTFRRGNEQAEAQAKDNAPAHKGLEGQGHLQVWADRPCRKEHADGDWNMTTVRAALLPILTLTGCLEERIELGPPVRLTAGARHTTELGFTVYWTREDAPPLTEVDELALSFVEEFGGTVARLLPYPIYIADDLYLPGGWFGMWWPGQQIDVALYANGQDYYMDRRHLVGLEWLIHEWRHVTEGYWHH